MIYRTQLFRPADLDSVKKVQAGYGPDAGGVPGTARAGARSGS